MMTQATLEQTREARHRQLERLQHPDGGVGYCYCCGRNLSEGVTTITVTRPAMDDGPAVNVSVCGVCWRMEDYGAMLLAEVEGDFIPLSSEVTTTRTP
jgi:hypothetical protein